MKIQKTHLWMFRAGAVLNLLNLGVSGLMKVATSNPTELTRKTQSLDSLLLAIGVATFILAFKMTSAPIGNHRKTIWNKPIRPIKMLKSTCAILRNMISDIVGRTLPNNISI